MSMDASNAMEMARGSKTFVSAGLPPGWDGAQLARLVRLATLGEMAAALAHELSQPLFCAQVYVASLIERPEARTRAPADMLEQLRGAAHSIERAIEVLASLRALASPHGPESAALDLNHAVCAVASLARSETNLHGITLRLDLADNLPAVRANRVLVEQVVLNLVRNAVQAVAPLGASAAQPRDIIVRTAALSVDGRAFVQVAVSDTGVGLSPEIADRLFEPFQTTKPDGMGLGLWLCRSIITTHGGRVWATANPGGGATFTFTLPAESPA